MLNRLFILIVVGFLCSCQEDEECVGCNLNPKIKLRFEAAGTKILTDSLVKAINEQIVDFEDSLTTQLTADERSSIQNLLVALRSDSTNFIEDYNLFRSGKTNLNSVVALGAASGFEQFQDSIIRDFSIPIDMHQDTSTYYFSYHGLTDTLQLYYQRDVIQSLDGVRMQISGIGVNEELSTFDSVLVKCYNRECSNDITTVYVYY